MERDIAFLHLDFSKFTRDEIYDYFEHKLKKTGCSGGKVVKVSCDVDHGTLQSLGISHERIPEESSITLVEFNGAEAAREFFHHYDEKYDMMYKWKKSTGPSSRSRSGSASSGKSVESSAVGKSGSKDASEDSRTHRSHDSFNQKLSHRSRKSEHDDNNDDEEASQAMNKPFPGTALVNRNIPDSERSRSGSASSGKSAGDPGVSLSTVRKYEHKDTSEDGQTLLPHDTFSQQTLMRRRPEHDDNNDKVLRETLVNKYIPESERSRSGSTSSGKSAGSTGASLSSARMRGSTVASEDGPIFPPLDASSQQTLIRRPEHNRIPPEPEHSRSGSASSGKSAGSLSAAHMHGSTVASEDSPTLPPLEPPSMQPSGRRRLYVASTEFPSPDPSSQEPWSRREPEHDDNDKEVSQAMHKTPPAAASLSSNPPESQRGRSGSLPSGKSVGFPNVSSTETQKYGPRADPFSEKQQKSREFDDDQRSSFERKPSGRPIEAGDGFDSRTEDTDPRVPTLPAKTRGYKKAHNDQGGGPEEKANLSAQREPSTRAQDVSDWKHTGGARYQDPRPGTARKAEAQGQGQGQGQGQYQGQVQGQFYTRPDDEARNQRDILQAPNPQAMDRSSEVMPNSEPSLRGQSSGASERDPKPSGERQVPYDHGSHPEARRPPPGFRTDSESPHHGVHQSTRMVSNSSPSHVSEACKNFRPTEADAREPSSAKHFGHQQAQAYPEATYPEARSGNHGKAQGWTRSNEDPDAGIGTFDHRDARPNIKYHQEAYSKQYDRSETSSGNNGQAQGRSSPKLYLQTNPKSSEPEQARPSERSLKNSGYGQARPSAGSSKKDEETRPDIHARGKAMHRSSSREELEERKQQAMPQEARPKDNDHGKTIHRSSSKEELEERERQVIRHETRPKDHAQGKTKHPSSGEESGDEQQMSGHDSSDGRAVSDYNHEDPRPYSLLVWTDIPRELLQERIQQLMSKHGISGTVLGILSPVEPQHVGISDVTGPCALVTFADVTSRKRVREMLETNRFPLEPDQLIDEVSARVNASHAQSDVKRLAKECFVMITKRGKDTYCEGNWLNIRLFEAKLNQPKTPIYSTVRKPKPQSLKGGADDGAHDRANVAERSRHKSKEEDDTDTGDHYTEIEEIEEIRRNQQHPQLQPQASEPSHLRRKSSEIDPDKRRSGSDRSSWERRQGRHEPVRRNLSRDGTMFADNDEGDFVEIESTYQGTPSQLQASAQPLSIGESTNNDPDRRREPGRKNPTREGGMLRGIGRGDGRLRLQMPPGEGQRPPDVDDDGEKFYDVVQDLEQKPGRSGSSQGHGRVMEGMGESPRSGEQNLGRGGSVHGHGRVMEDMGGSPRRGQDPEARDWTASGPGSPPPEAFNDWIRDPDLQGSCNPEHFSASGRSAKMRTKEHEYEEIPSPGSLQQREFEKPASTNEAPVPQAPPRKKRVLDEAASYTQTLKASPILRTFIMKQVAIQQIQARYKVRIQMSADGLTVAGDNQDDLLTALHRLSEEKETIEEEEDIKRSSQIPDAMTTEIAKMVRSTTDTVACVFDEEAMAVLAMGPGAQHFIKEVNMTVGSVGDYEVIDAAEEAKEDKKEASGTGHEYMETLHIDVNIMKYFSIASKMPVVSSYVRVNFQELSAETGQVTLKSYDEVKLKNQVARFREECNKLQHTIIKKEVRLEAIGAVNKNIETRFPDVHVDLQEDNLLVELMGPKQAVREAEKEIVRLSKQPVRPKTSSSAQSPSQTVGASADYVEPMSFWTVADSKRKHRLHVHALVHDITRIQVDVIVNAANEKLQHGGGVAKKIADVGGQELQDDCKAYIKKNSKIKVTNHFISKPGGLRCKHVMHAVGPKWEKDKWKQEGLRSQLQETFRKCLMAASDKKFKSIAIPSISAGIFGFHPTMVAMIMAKAVADFARGQNQNLSDIYLVDILPDTVRILQKQLQGYDILRQEVSFTGGDALFNHQGRRRRRVLVEEEHVGPGTGSVDEAEKTRAAMAEVRTLDPTFASGGPHSPQSPLSLSKSFTSYTSEPQASSSQLTSSQTSKSRLSRSLSHKASGFTSYTSELQASSSQDYSSSKDYSSQLTSSQASSSKDHKADPSADKADPPKEEPNDCPICLDPITDLERLDKCGHEFCKDCIQESFQHKPVCPLCGVLYGKLTGNQPTNGTMKDRVEHSKSLPGYSGYGIIIIDYHFSGGIQGDEHPQPGQRYSGTSRRAFLPDNAEGQKVLGLLREAFDARLVFTIGRSVTSGQENTVTWNDIHHKTNVHGGPERYGYPDPTYLSRVTLELAAKGITG